MNNQVFKFEMPQNEPTNAFAKGSKEREAVIAELKKLSSQEIEIPVIIGGKEIRTGNTDKVVMPHNHHKALATYHKAGEKEIKMAIEEALKAKKMWENLPFIERASIMLRAAELLSTKYRSLILASTMLGQNKNVYQAEIDAACETIDYLRYNTYFASKIYSEQPRSMSGQLNFIEYRPLEGFVFAVTPFNFTAIASNLNMAPALMGNTTIWKPSRTALFSNYFLMQIYKEAGLPDGVLNFLPGQGSTIGDIVLPHKDFGGLHFTGSNETFNSLWQQISNNLRNYRSYPRIVGETGGKDFIFVHNSADPLEVASSIVRGAFEFQGQKCSAASRGYIPKSLWNEVKQHLLDQISQIKVGGVEDFSNFVNAVIDEPSFDKIMSYINFAKQSNEAEILIGGEGDKSVGYFVKPTVIVTTNPYFKTMQEEIFGPVFSIFVYDDDKYQETLEICNNTSPYGLTGSIFGYDRFAIMQAYNTLRYAAGNFYINDKPTGAMVGVQPFGGSRASGTNDKAGGYFNLLRWTSPRTVKETFLPPTDFKYPFMEI